MFLLGLLLLTSPPAEALKRAEASYAEAQYAEAIAALDELYARRDLSIAERRETTLYLGMAHLALGHEEAARARFHEVLEGDDQYALPRYTSPKIRSLFEQVRAEVRAAPVLVALPPETAPLVRLSFKAERLGNGRPVIHWRRVGDSQWSEADGLQVAPPLVATMNDIELEYYGEVRAGDRLLARAGSADHPMHVRVPGRAEAAEPAPVAQPHFYQRWWFWTAVGVVAVGGGLAAYAATRSDTTTGTLDVRFQVP